MITEMTGNLFDSKAKIIGHGANACGVMGAGIAKTFRDKYPEMYKNYVELCMQHKPEDMVGRVYIWDKDFMQLKSEHVVANIFSQDQPGPNAKLEWLVDGLYRVFNYARYMGFDKIAIPQIGCGIGGLEWDTVKAELYHHFNDDEVDMELWTFE